MDSISNETTDALSHEVAQYRAFIANSAEGIWRAELPVPISIDLPEDEQIASFYAGGYLAECNDAFARMYGFTAANEIIGARLADMIPAENPANVEYLRAFIRSGYQLREAESTEVDRNGNEKHFANSLVGVVENGVIGKAWGTQRDITEQRRLENALRESKERYRALVDASSQIVWTSAPNGEMHGPQPAWCVFTGQTEAEIQGMGWLAAVHPDDAEATLTAWQAATRSNEVFTIEHSLRRFDGAWRTFLVRAVPVLNADNEVREWIGAHSDVTERREAQAKQKRFVREMLSAVTEGRLRLCDEADLPAPFPPFGEPVPLVAASLHTLRQRAQQAAEQLHFPRMCVGDLLTAAGEAAMNAVRHATGGVGRVHWDEQRRLIQVWIRDTGSGIEETQIPRATLEAGYSSAGTLGHGFSLMLSCADRIWLVTSPQGTTVVVEMGVGNAIPIQ